MAEWFSCKGVCSGSDPTSDTVKIDPAMLAAGKENVMPLRQTPQERAQKAYEAQKELEELRRAQEEIKAAEERRQMEEEAKRRREDELAKRRREEEVEEQRRATERIAAEVERAAAQAAFAAELEAARQQELQLEEEKVAQQRERLEREAAQRAADAEEQAARANVAKFCKDNGFEDTKTWRKTGFMNYLGSRFALHEAVTKKDVEIVRLMVRLEVDKGLKNSKGQTAEDLANKMNKDGSMDAILASLK